MNAVLNRYIHFEDRCTGIPCILYTSCVFFLQVLYREKLDGAPPRRPRTFFHEHLPTDGMYVVTLHPGTGRATGHLFATAHNVNGAFYGMEEFLRHVQPGRLVVFCTVVREPGWRLGYTAKQEDRGEERQTCWVRYNHCNPQSFLYKYATFDALYLLTKNAPLSV